MNRKTTLFGLLTAIATALSTIGDLAPPWSLIIKLIGAAGLALLGWAAADKSGQK